MSFGNNPLGAFFFSLKRAQQMHFLLGMLDESLAAGLSGPAFISCFLPCPERPSCGLSPEEHESCCDVFVFIADVLK